ncbi:MAG: S-layer homology domain-containing protein [Evtepia sp.]
MPAGWRPVCRICSTAMTTIAYVIGYPDGNVHPQGNISRAETATIFFRLLKADTRDGNLTAENDLCRRFERPVAQQGRSPRWQSSASSRAAARTALTPDAPDHPCGVCRDLRSL